MKPAERFARRLVKLDKLPPSTAQSPAFGKYNVTSQWPRVSMLHHFANTKSWRHLLLEASLVPNCTDFLRATLFERVPVCGPWKQSTPRTTLVENGNELIYSTSDRAVTGSFGGR